MKHEKKSASKAEMIANVQESTATALIALNHFYQSLVDARMRSSSKSYRQMCDTLVGQRLWMLDKSNSDVEKNFRELSKVGQSILDVLCPYVTSFEKLSALDRIEKVSNPKDLREPLASSDLANERNSEANCQKAKLRERQQLVIDVLGSNGGRASVTKLRTKTKLRRKELDDLISRLVVDGRINCKAVGGRRMLALVSSASARS